MPSVPSFEPEIIIIGDTAAWKKSFSAYPAGIWDLSYTIANGDHEYTLGAGAEVTADGTGFAITIPAATTATFAAGEYYYRGRVTDGTTVKTVSEGTLRVTATNSVYDELLHVTATLAAIEAVIQGRASKDQEEYSIKDRSLKRTPIPELLTLKSHYKAEKNRLKRQDRIRRGLGSGSAIRTRFV